MDADWPVIKDAENEVPVPTEWRNTLKQIVDAFAAGDFMLERGIANVLSLSDREAFYARKALVDYGATLLPLPPESWQSSVCQWMIEYWDVMVDLYTVEEGRSDLVLRAEVYAEGEAYKFKIRMIYVP